MAATLYQSIAQAIGFSFLGVFFLALGLLPFRMKQRLENIPMSNVRSLAMGLVKIQGEVVPAERKTLESPLSGRACVYYRHKVEKRAGIEWNTIKDSEEMVRFFLRDSTGRVLVDLHGARIEIPMKREIIEPDVESKRKMRLSEYYIAPGDNLFILGTAGDNPLVEEATAHKGHEDIMIHRGQNEKFYYVSDTSENKIIEAFKMKYRLGFSLGAILIAFSLAAMFLVIFLYKGAVYL